MIVNRSAYVQGKPRFVANRFRLGILAGSSYPCLREVDNIMHAKVSIKGQIVIPAELREEYAIAPGDMVDVRDGDGRILIFLLR
jgi:AbrB family looped-hinge helix DNA binding protein